MMGTTNILCFGDSNTWGYIPGSEGERYSADVRWPGILQAELGGGVKVIEEGQNGRMSVWDDPMEPLLSKCGLTHLPVVLESHKPLDLVIIMLGTNDLKSHMNNSPHSIANGVITLVDRVLASDSGPCKHPPQVLMVCPAPVSEGKCPFGHLFTDAPEKSRDLPVSYSELAVDRGVSFLNAGDFATCPVPDCIHLDASGHASLGRAIAEKVRSMGFGFPSQ